MLNQAGSLSLKDRKTATTKVIFFFEVSDFSFPALILN